MQDHGLEKLTRLNNELTNLQRELTRKNADLEVINRQLATEVANRQETEQSLRESEEALRHLSGQLLNLQEKERRRIARELHDSTAQKLTRIILSLGLLEEMLESSAVQAKQLTTDCISTAQDCAQELRSLSQLLHPPLLDELGLEVALDTFVADFSRRGGIEVTLEVQPGLADLSNDASLVLFRVAQESLENVVRHSGSSSASVQLVRTRRRVILEVADQGHGIAPEMLKQIQDRRFGSGFGIMGMQERLEQFGGTLEIDSSSDGAIVRAFIPTT